MKHKDERFITINKIGRLEKDDDGDFVIVVEIKDEVETVYKLDELLEEIVGQDIQINSKLDN